MRHPERLVLICLSLLATDSRADELGRLFYNPEQRRQLERGESGDTAPHLLKGIVQKHGGRRTIWLGDRMESHAGSTRPESQRLTSPNNAPVRIKVGETIP